MAFVKKQNKGESVALFWDYENCHAIGYHGHLILDRINQKVQEIYGTNVVTVCLYTYQIYPPIYQSKLF